MEKCKVIYIGDDKFDLYLPKPVKADTSVLLLTGTHKIEVILNNNAKKILGVRGIRQNLLDWLTSIGITSAAIQEFSEAMIDEAKK